MADTIFQILMWAIPSGGMGAAIAWIANRKIRQVKIAKEIHDTYKTMYADVSELLVNVKKENEKLNDKVDELKKENERTRRSLNRLCRAIEAIQLCPHRSSCPVRNELSLTEDYDNKCRETKLLQGQHNNRGKTTTEHQSTNEFCQYGDSDGQPP